ncbi:hypothetical protein [Phocaeicola massiliensis]|uniref:hypothetical protein n=1 Tax=Phocaeicola massiliensis TaxID=204516 RepID=UPI00189989D3|nr:hypothetical protein [Phocaeicola massiliensis]
MNLENISKQQLFREITELMQPLYFPVPYEENNIQELAQQEYKLFCKVISARYGFDNDKYILAHNGHSLFDIVHDDVICELRSRMRRDSYLLQSETIRWHLVALVRQAVVRAGGCLGTCYKNVGIHHMEYSSADVYEDVPAVVFQSGMVCTAGGYESAMLYDIYLTSDDILMCTLDDKYSSEYDIPFNTLLLESMLDIVHWLRFHSFLPDTDEPEWVCEECGSSEVETLAWVNPNEDNSFVDFLGTDDRGNNWCRHCEEHTGLALFADYDSNQSSLGD